jgi:ACS family hexuronate transporter-like MFS transporter
VAALLFCATVINYLDRQTLSVLAPELRDRFHMTNTDYSHILFAFLLAYMIMQSGSGKLMDWMGTRRGFALSIAWWSMAAVMHAGAASARAFAACRFLLGVGEAGNWPGGVKAISEWFPTRERAFAIGLFNSGSTLGAIIAPPLVAWIALTWGWRSAFLATGVSGFLWMAVWLATVHPPARPPEPEVTPGAALRWRDLLRYREVWSLVAGRMMCEPVWWFYVFWLPEYLRRVRHFTLAEIGLFAWIPFLTADIGSMSGGWLSGLLIRRGQPVLRSRETVMGVSAACMVAGIPAVLSGDSRVCLALISVVTLAYSMWAANILTLPADLFPRKVVASVSGISGTGAAFGGMCFNLLVGALVDRFGYVPVFAIAAVMPLAAAACIIGGLRRAKALPAA